MAREHPVDFSGVQVVQHADIKKERGKKHCRKFQYNIHRFFPPW